jgi:hypothetical protein
MRGHQGWRALGSDTGRYIAARSSSPPFILLALCKRPQSTGLTVERQQRRVISTRLTVVLPPERPGLRCHRSDPVTRLRMHQRGSLHLCDCSARGINQPLGSAQSCSVDEDYHHLDARELGRRNRATWTSPDSDVGISSNRLHFSSAIQSCAEQMMFR